MFEVKAGAKCYAITHAYYHLLFEIVEMMGPQRARVKNVRFVYSSKRSWTEFFANGCGPAGTTVYHTFPDGEVSWIDIFEWRHEIP